MKKIINQQTFKIINSNENQFKEINLSFSNPKRELTQEQESKSFQDILRKLIRHNKLERFFEMIRELNISNNLDVKLSLLESQYRNFLRNQSLRLMDPKLLTVEFNQIKMALLKLINEDLKNN